MFLKIVTLTEGVSERLFLEVDIIFTIKFQQNFLLVVINFPPFQSGHLYVYPCVQIHKCTYQVYLYQSIIHVYLPHMSRLHIYIYIHIHIHTCIYIHIHTHMKRFIISQL